MTALAASGPVADMAAELHKLSAAVRPPADLKLDRAAYAETIAQLDKFAAASRPAADLKLDRAAAETVAQLDRRPGDSVTCGGSCWFDH